MQAGESESMQNQVVIYKGWFLSYNTYDCSSFVMNGKAVMDIGIINKKTRFRQGKPKYLLQMGVTVGNLYKIHQKRLFLFPKKR